MQYQCRSKHAHGKLFFLQILVIKYDNYIKYRSSINSIRCSYYVMSSYGQDLKYFSSVHGFVVVYFK